MLDRALKNLDNDELLELVTFQGLQADEAASEAGDAVSQTQSKIVADDDDDVSLNSDDSDSDIDKSRTE
jgi:hypothetical protein